MKPLKPTRRPSEVQLKKTANPDLLTMSPMDLNVSVRVRNQFKWNNITTLEGLWIITRLHPERFGWIRNIGAVGQNEISEAFRELGL